MSAPWSTGDERLCAPEHAALFERLRGKAPPRSISVEREYRALRGGLMSVERASQSPVHTMLSGPAGGVSGAAFMASLAGYPQALGFDMGGTSTDVSLIQDGRPTISRQTLIGYYPIKVPSVDVHSGGRRRWLDRPRADDRCVARGSGERRRGARTGLLRQGRCTADRDRRQCGAGAATAAASGRQDNARHQGGRGGRGHSGPRARSRPASCGTGDSRHR